MNERYRHERAQTELALYMIASEARTNTIRACTGLSDDRIRRLCTLYFSDRNGVSVRRRRGKSPQQIARFVKNADHQLQATTLMHLFVAHGLLQPDAGGGLAADWQQPDLAVGARFCRAFAAYRAVHATALFGFEWAWNLLLALTRNEELTMACCDRCNADYLQDRYALDFHICPACEIRTERRRRPGARHYVDS